MEARSPVDLERELRMPGGHIFHRDLSWPFAEERARGRDGGAWRPPIRAVLLCGAGARRGGGVSGIPGRNAAMAVALSEHSTICVQVKLAASRSPLSTRTCQTCVREPTWSGSPIPVELVAHARRGDHVDLQLDGREPAALGQVAQGSPGGDGVGERDPRAAVDVAHRVQMPAIDAPSSRARARR